MINLNNCIFGDSHWINQPLHSHSHVTINRVVLPGAICLGKRLGS